MEFAVILVLVASISVGVVAAVVRTWSIHSRLYSVEDRVNVLEGNLSREVKIRAAAERWKKPAQEELAILDAMKNAPVQKASLPWYKRQGLKRGAYNGLSGE